MEWRDVIWYEWLYKVSDMWDVIWVSPARRRAWIAKTMSKFYTWHWYEWVGLSNGVTKQVLVHKIVAEAFLWNIPDWMQVNHKNWIKNDNRLDNLEIVTRSENIKHSYQDLWRSWDWEHSEDYKKIQEANKRKDATKKIKIWWVKIEVGMKEYEKFRRDLLNEYIYELYW